MPDLQRKARKIKNVKNLQIHTMVAPEKPGFTICLCSIAEIIAKGVLIWK
jgi:hypothetical protein